MDEIIRHFLHFVVSLFVVVFDTFLCDNALSSLLLNNFFIVVFILYAVFIATYMIMSPAIIVIYKDLKEKYPKNLPEKMIGLLDVVRKSIKEVSLFFSIGVLAFLIYESSLPGFAYSNELIITFMLFCIISIVWDMKDCIYLLNTLCRATIDNKE